MRWQYLKESRLVRFLLIVNVISILYFGLIAAPVYTSTSSLIVRSGETPRSTMTSVLSGATGNGAEFGGYVFSDFVKSWDEFNRLRGPLGVGQRLGAGDFVSRFGGLATLFSTSEIALWHYYQDSIEVEVDTKSGIVSMVVSGYDPQFSHNLSKALLAHAVTHLTQMNAQREEQMVRSARERVAQLSQQLSAQDAALAAYRTRIGVFEPDKVYESRLALLNQLSVKQTELKAQFQAAISETRNSPSVNDLRTALAETTARIGQEKDNISTTSRQAADYDNLKVGRDNIIQLLTQASGALHEAQSAAVDNGYYLNVISEPSNSRDAELPHRLRWIFIVLAASVLVWGILR